MSGSTYCIIQSIYNRPPITGKEYWGDEKYYQLLSQTLLELLPEE